MGPTPSSYWKRMENFSQKGSPTSIYLKQPILIDSNSPTKLFYVCLFICPPGVVFKALALWANAFYKSKCPSVCVFVRPSVCLPVHF